jgi:hypothetical protein
MRQAEEHGRLGGAIHRDPAHQLGRGVIGSEVIASPMVLVLRSPGITRSG